MSVLRRTITDAARATFILAAAACGPGGATSTSKVESTPPAWTAAHQATVATGDSAMVVTAAPLATRVGVNVLRAGGNAVDAAVAVAFALEVVYPTAGNIGGGGFIVA